MAHATSTVAMLAALALTGLAALAQTAPPPVGGRLAGAMLLGEAPLTPTDLPDELSSSDRLRLMAYVDRARVFKTRQGHVAGTPDAWKRRERLEREIAAGLEVAGIEEAAHAIAWSEGPFGLTAQIDADAEARWAEGLLREPSSAAAAPFLYAMLAARYRMQLEQAPDDRPALERLAKKYRTMIDRVRNSEDGLFRILADDLDNRQALTEGATRHPRQYLPDT